MATGHTLAKMQERVPKHKYFKSNGELGIGTWKLCSATLIQVCTLIKLNGFEELGAIKEKTHQWTTVCTSSHTTATAFFLNKSFDNIPRNLSSPTNDSGLP